MKDRFYLRIGDDTLEEAAGFLTRAAAVREFQIVATELWGFGQRLEATLHRAPDREHVAEYPDWVLSIGPRGGVVVDRA
jgi:hypothetical protein